MAKRGFTPLTAVLVVLVDIGEVLDYHVLSKAFQKYALEKASAREMMNGVNTLALVTDCEECKDESTVNP